MPEKYMQEGEVVTIHGNGVYCDDGTQASVKNGYFVLTNKRLVVFKMFTPKGLLERVAAIIKDSFTIGLFYVFVAAVVVTMAIAFIMSFTPFRTALFGLPIVIVFYMFYVVGIVIERKIRKNRQLTTLRTESDVEYSIPVDQIGWNVVNSGVQKVLVITTSGSDIFKIDIAENKKKWRAMLIKTISPQAQA